MMFYQVLSSHKIFIYLKVKIQLKIFYEGLHHLFFTLGDAVHEVFSTSTFFLGWNHFLSQKESERLESPNLLRYICLLRMGFKYISFFLYQYPCFFPSVSEMSKRTKKFTQVATGCHHFLTISTVPFYCHVVTSVDGQQTRTGCLKSRHTEILASLLMGSLGTHFGIKLK